MPSHPLYHLYRQSKVVKLRRPLFPEKWVKILDKVVVIVSLLGPVFTLPQIYKIYAMQSAEGLSLISWGSYLAFNFPMFLYGLAHREKVISRMYFLWILVNGSIVVGILLFGRVTF
ncbi:MAG: PQ-loop domain-containing transporter [Patescibacteria group bacterium]